MLNKLYGILLFLKWVTFRAAVGVIYLAFSTTFSIA